MTAFSLLLEYYETIVINKEPKHTIYLDLDGVIFPHWHKSDGGRVQTEKDGPYYLRSELQDGLAIEWIGMEEFYYSDITRRLGEFVARGAHIMPSSSRSIDLLFSYPSVAEDLGGIDRYLVIDRFEAGLITHKARAVSNNWHGVIDLSHEQRGWERLRSMATTHPLAKPAGSKAVWIDDHADVEKLESLDDTRLLDDPLLKIIRPLGVVGLTMPELDEVEEFLFET